MISFLRALGVKAWVLIAIGAIVVVSGLYFSFRASSTPQLVKAEIRDVTEVVAVTGTVKPPSNIDLEFLTGGRVVWRPVLVGQHVARGTVLMALDARDLDIQITKAGASLEGAEAKLDQLKAGATAETIKQYEDLLLGSYTDALSAFDNELTKGDKALVILRADVFLASNKVRPDFQMSSDAEAAQLEEEKISADAKILALHQMRDAIDPPAGNFSAMESLFQQASPSFDAVRTVLVDSSNLLVHVVSPSVTQATLTTYLTDIAAARAEFDTTSRSLSSATVAIQTAKDNLSLKQEPPRQVDLDVLQANVKSAQADLALLEKQKSDTALVAPVDGVVTNISYELGENARPSTLAVSMISSGGAEIEANVPEADIAKVSVGNPVTITLDALPGEVFQGKVIHIDPAETVIDGVTNFKIKVAFDKNDPRIKTGVTANLGIETLRKPRVLTLPQLGIIENDSGTFVDKVVNGKTERASISTGIRSSDSYVEILSGLKEGDEVLNAGLKTH